MCERERNQMEKQKQKVRQTQMEPPVHAHWQAEKKARSVEVVLKVTAPRGS